MSFIRLSPVVHFEVESTLTRFLLDQRSDFSLIGKSPSFDILFRVDQLTVTLYIEDTAAAFDQFDI